MRVPEPNTGFEFVQCEFFMFCTSEDVVSLFVGRAIQQMPLSVSLGVSGTRVWDFRMVTQ